MKTIISILGIAIVVFCSTSIVHARDTSGDSRGLRIIRTYHGGITAAPYGIETQAEASEDDTFCVVWYDFEIRDWQGWTTWDRWAQEDTFFHVDDFSGLAGGDFGRLTAIEGEKSLWCGTGPRDDDYVCSWTSAPGYGPAWKQLCQSDAISFSGTLTWTYDCVIDSEEGYDFTYVEYDAGYGNWIELGWHSGIDTLAAQHTILGAQAATKLRWRFVSDFNSDDDDGIHDTDGAIIIDNITLTDNNGLIDHEDFESYPSGAKGELGIWNTAVVEGAGDYAGLANNLIDKDPCQENFTTQVIFFDGSPHPSADYPGLYDTPFCLGGGGISAPCQENYAVSPIIDMKRYSTSCDEFQDSPIPVSDEEQLGGAILGFDVYRDLPLQNLVMYTWAVRTYDEPGCPGKWQARGALYYGDDRDYAYHEMDITDLVSPQPVQFAIGVVDMCPYYYGYYGYCSTHTPSPYIDDVRIYRYRTDGPVWSVLWDSDLFGDTFPEDTGSGPDPMEEFCRADSRGDSCVVVCSAPLAGRLDTLLTGEERVYCHVNVHFLGPDGKPDLYGSAIEGTYGTYVSDDGDWTVLLCEPALDFLGRRRPNGFCVDLNDSLFTRGYMIEYYFSAYDLDGQVSTLPSDAESPDGDRYEFTCLPTLRQVPGILYCDNFNARGSFEGIAQTFFDQAFAAVTPAGESEPDRYDASFDLSGQTSVLDASSILCQAYHTIIHDSGEFGTITAGSNDPEFNEAQLLIDWMALSDHRTNLLVMGDAVASVLWGAGTASAVELLSTICGVTLVSDSYYDVTGGREAGGTVTPLVSGSPVGPYSGLEYFVSGGCPVINDFDVFAKTGPGAYALQYPEYNSLPHYAGIYTDQLNDTGHALRTSFIGHSLMHMRDTEKDTPVRNVFLRQTYVFFENGVNASITDSGVPGIYSLSQNFPNPFNPSTRIRFSLPARGHVRLEIYDVSGKLVKTLKDGQMDAGYHEVSWYGKNNMGRNAASGVYFYKLGACGFESVKKMVLLR